MSTNSIIWFWEFFLWHNHYIPYLQSASHSSEMASTNSLRQLPEHLVTSRQRAIGDSISFWIRKTNSLHGIQDDWNSWELGLRMYHMKCWDLYDSDDSVCVCVCVCVCVQSFTSVFCLQQTRNTLSSHMTVHTTGDLPFDLAREPNARQTYLVISES